MPSIASYIKPKQCALWALLAAGLAWNAPWVGVPALAQSQSQSQSQGMFGTACPNADELLELNDLLFSTGFMCTRLDQALHAAYDPWETPTGPAPFRAVPTGIASTIQRLSAAGDFDGAEIQLFSMPESPLRSAVQAALTQSRAGTVEALFMTDDLAGRAFRMGNGFDWDGAEALMVEANQASPDLGQSVYRSIALGAVLGASERESEPFQSIGWTKMPLWLGEPEVVEAQRLQVLLDLEHVVSNWGGRSILYLRLGARQLGITKLNDDLYDEHFNPECRPRTDWPSAAVQSLALVLEFDEGCANVAPLALRNWDVIMQSGLPVPAWPIDQ